MNSEALNLLHLSDIHFKKAANYDLDADLRDQVLKDVKRVADRLQKVTGILVTGDVAFSGKAEEYKIATEWLGKLCAAVECPAENVWTIPGNHDVDRSLIQRNLIVQDAHTKLRRTPLEKLSDELRKLLEDDGYKTQLFLPLANYNEFARQFGCRTTAENLWWETDLPLNDGSTLRLRGANSTIVSDQNDDDTSQKLVLGSYQVAPTEQEGVEYLVLCHHPPQWLFDTDDVEKWLSARVRIHLFGHKHIQKLDQINQTLRMTSGAMHPDRGPLWVPRYNALSVSVTGEGGKRFLSVQAHPRIWNDTEMCFQGEYNSQGLDVREYSLAISPWHKPILVPTNHKGGLLQISDNANTESKQSVKETHAGPTVSMNPARRLTYRFLNLPYQTRLDIVREVGLVREEDKSLPDVELYVRYFERARQESKLAELWGAVEIAHDPKNKDKENPFKKT